MVLQRAQMVSELDVRARIEDLQLGQGYGVAAVDAGAFAVPGVEDGADGAMELLDGFLGQVLARLPADDPLEFLGEESEFPGVKVVIVTRPALRPVRGDGLLEQITVHTHHRTSARAADTSPRRTAPGRRPWRGR